MIGVGWTAKEGVTSAALVQLDSGYSFSCGQNVTHLDRVMDARAQATPAQIRAWLDTGPRGGTK